MVVCLFVVIFAIAGSSNVVANTETYPRFGVSIASGCGAAKIVPFRLGVQKEFEKHWWIDRTWSISGYKEASLYTLYSKKGHLPNSHRQLDAAAFAGVFRFNRSECIAIGWPYLEVGIGLSFLSQKEISGRNLGMHFQFEDRFGIGVRFGKKREYDLGYKAVHFSNAYLGSSNHGINLHLLMLGYWFK